MSVPFLDRIPRPGPRTAGLGAFAAALLAAGAAAAEGEVVAPDAGNTAWMMTSTALVLLMTLPGLALFYAGLVRAKNALSLFMQCMVSAGVVGVLWVLVGYSLAFAEGNAFVGGLSKLGLSGITKDTPDPPAGVVVKDPATGEPTGMLRNAYGVLKGVPAPAGDLSAAETRAAVKKLFALYSSLGLTGVADRNADRAALDLYRGLHAAGELTVRVNAARAFSPAGSPDEMRACRLIELRATTRASGRQIMSAWSGTTPDDLPITPFLIVLPWEGEWVDSSSFLYGPNGFEDDLTLQISGGPAQLRDIATICRMPRTTG